MAPSIAGLLVCMVLLLIGAIGRSPLIIALISSFGFGATAIGTITALGGSSPMIFSAFAGLLVMRAATQRQSLHILVHALGRQPQGWWILALLVYGAASAYMFPRLFEGQTLVVATLRSESRMGVVPLAPTSGNITQTAYFVLGGLTCLAVVILLLRRQERFKDLARGFMIGAMLNAGLGIVDVCAKSVGLGDVLAPIRTATFVLLTEDAMAGFVRISGGFSEASAFGGTTVLFMAFTLTYWRYTRSRLALTLSIVQAILLLFSTSTTAYGGCAVIAAVLAFQLGLSLLKGRFRQIDILAIMVILVASAVLTAVVLFNPHLLDPFYQLFDAAIFNKTNTISAQERGNWNKIAMQAFWDTGGIGVGFGSLKASNWAICVLSQTGVVGSAILAVPLVYLARGLHGLVIQPEDIKVMALAQAARAAAFAALVVATIASGTADPGVPFFVCLGTFLACRTCLQGRSAKERLPMASF
jgi:hypothetical protein